jgi:A/G-specific adenine glycosylase
VYRVLARHFGIDTPINTTEGKKLFAALAQELLPPNEAAAYNQAIMDFGAVQCTPQSPKCMECMLAESCEALRSGRVNELPVKLKTLKVTERHLIYIYIRCQGQTAIRRRGPGDIWQGLWEPMLVDAESAVPPTASLLRQNVKHVLTHRVLYADFYLLETDKRPKLPSDYIWIAESALDNYALPRLIEVLLSFLPK